MCSCGPKATIDDVIRALDEDLPMDKISVLGQGVGDMGLSRLGDALKRRIARKSANDSESLYLMSNGIGPRGVQALLFALREGHALKTINLNGNTIGDEGAKMLVDFLATDTVLTNVYVLNNGLSSAGRDLLSHTVIQRPGIKLYF